MSRACELTGEAPQLAALIAQLQFQLCDHHGQLPHPQQHWGHNRVGWRLALVFLWHSSAFKLFRVLTKYLWKHHYVLMKCHKGNFVSKLKNDEFFYSIWEETLVFSVPKYLSFSNKAVAAGVEQNLLWTVVPFCLILWAIVLLLKICPLVSCQSRFTGEEKGAPSSRGAPDALGERKQPCSRLCSRLAENDKWSPCGEGSSERDTVVRKRGHEHDVFVTAVVTHCFHSLLLWER